VNKRTILTAAFTFTLFLVLDFIWLTTAGDAIYRPRIGALLAERPDANAALLFYLVYWSGLDFFVLRRAASARDALTLGAAFGLVAYGTYDLTNQATLAGWSWTVTAIDMVWGTVLTGISALSGFWAAEKLIAKQRRA
jgi:uncharacterized membrane protein